MRRWLGGHGRAPWRGGARGWKRGGWLACLACLACLIAFPAQRARAGPVSVEDDRGVRIHMPAAPARIVTLLPSLTEFVCQMGACERLVGTDRYSNHPAAVRSLPKAGGLDDANIELILTLRPDVVLLSTSSRVIERLEGLGLRVVALEPKTYDDVRRVAGKVAQLLGLPAEGARLWGRIEAQVRDAALGVPPGARGMTVYYEVDSAPYAAGESSFIGQTLARLSLVNIVDARMGPFPKLNPEYVVRANPQLIMVSARSAGGLPERPGWDRIDAVRQRRICTFSAEDGDVLSRPGPRMGEAAQIMARCLKALMPAKGAH